MLVKLATDKGYYTGNKKEIEIDDTITSDTIHLSSTTNSFAWDIEANDGEYQLSLKIEDLPPKTKLKQGAVTLTVHYLKTNNKKTLKSKKLVKGNNIVFEPITINTKHTKTLSLIFNSSKPLNVTSCQVEYNDAKITPIKHKFEISSIGLSDEHPNPEFTSFYREFNIKNDVPYTDYSIMFNKGGFTMSPKGITFNVFHVGEYGSFVKTKDKRVEDVINTETVCSVTYPIELSTKHSYKLFLKSEQITQQDIPATDYHAFWGIVGQSKWHYIVTLCQSGHNTPTQVTSQIEARKHNNHLYTRVFKYGNGWDFTGDRVYPIEKINCCSNDNYQNSKTILDKPLYRIKMYLGGGVHTTTPNKYYTFKQNEKNIPYVLLDFNLDDYTSKEEQ